MIRVMPKRGLHDENARQNIRASIDDKMCRFNDSARNACAVAVERIDTLNSMFAE